jgi:hypothetical protein
VPAVPRVSGHCGLCGGPFTEAGLIYYVSFLFLNFDQGMELELVAIIGFIEQLCREIPAAIYYYCVLDIGSIY